MAKRTVEELELELNRLVTELERSLNSTLNRILVSIDSLPEVERQAAILALPNLISSAPGVAASLAGLEVIYGNELRAAIDNVARATGQEIVATAADLQVTAGLIEITKNQVDAQLTGYITDLQETLYTGTLTSAAISVLDFRDTFEPRLFRNIETEMLTSLMSYNRTYNIAKAQEVGITKFRYTGPDDSVTRPFCDHLLGDVTQQLPSGARIPVEPRKHGIYTIDEIRTMRNGQGLPVFQAGGGYNCRHTWSAVSDDRAKQLGFKG